MATAQLEKVQEFLTCSVCMDVYTDPCTLTCQHSFCRKCITKYTNTRPDAVRSKTIPCPCCRQVTKVPDPSKPVEEWAGQLKASIILQGLIDTSQTGNTNTEIERCCNVCEHVGETTLAKLWCPDCEVALCDRCAKYHRGNQAFREHDVCDLSEEVRVKRSRKINCKEHKKNCIEFHCNDCKRSACQTCCIIYHRSCKSVVTIQSMKSEMTTYLNDRRHKMSLLLKVRSVRVTEKNTLITETSQKKMMIRSQIREVSQSAMDKIKQMEKKLMDKLDQVTDEQTSQLQANVKTDEIEMQMYRQYCEFIDQTMKTESVMDMYDTYQACVSGALVIAENTDKETTNRKQIDNITFTQNSDKIKSLLENQSLGDIRVTFQDASGSMPNPVLCDTIDTRTEDDEEDPYLYDVTVLVVDGVQTPVVTDKNNDCVKSFFTKHNKPCHSKLLLDASPIGISKLKENQVMVAVPASRQIVTVEVKPELKLISTIKTGKKYWGLTVIDNTSMAAGFWDFVSEGVHILNMEGQVMKSITRVNNVKLFSCPDYMCVNRMGHILVSDYGKKSVICLTPEGNVVWTYTGKLNSPFGITTTESGAVLVADQTSGKIIQLTEIGQFDRDVLTLTTPSGVFSDRNGSLFVCENGLLQRYFVI